MGLYSGVMYKALCIEGLKATNYTPGPVSDLVLSDSDHLHL